MDAPTERLRLRRFAPADLRDYLAYQTHPETLRYLSAATPKNGAEAIDYLERQSTLEIGDEGGWLGFAVELRSTNRMIGEVGVYLQPRKGSASPQTEQTAQTPSLPLPEPSGQGDIGWSLHPDHWHRGYATEAARALLAYVFAERRLHRVTSGCDARNVASFRLMERLGMRREAHFRQSHCADGAWQDQYLYALLREEWLAREGK